MSTELDPVVGNWYQHTDDDEKKFTVLDLDQEEGVVEIQYFDGDLDQIDLDEWYELVLEPIGAPEDWTGAMDGAEEDIEDDGWPIASRRRNGSREISEDDWDKGLDDLDERYADEEPREDD
ncbi:MAG: DUF6763 family protein [Gammaproteobacteria bacterium]